MSDLNITLDSFKPRDYQKEFFDALEVKGYRRFFLVVARRGGKDRMCWEAVIYQMLLKPILVLYALPTFAQARRCIWDALNLDGSNFLDSIDPRLIAKKNEHEMKITLVNGSRLSLIGGDSYDTSLVGSNAYMIVLSEASLMDLDNIYGYCRPILAANGGILIIQGTPRGKNAFYHMYNAVKKDPDWFTMFKTAYDTNHIPPDVLAKEKLTMSEGLFAQEYECSFERGQEGIIFGYVLDKMKQDNRFTVVNYDPTALTHVVFDLGYEDDTALLWFQVMPNGFINVIDCFSDNHLGLDYYIDKVRSKPYRLGTVFGCHDMRVHEFGNGGRQRLHMAQDMGMDMTVLDQIGKEDSIEQTLVTFPKVWIDSRNCQRLMDALENYRREWDDKNQLYKKDTIRNWAAHYADSFRYMCQAVNLLGPSLNDDEFERKKREAFYGNRGSGFGPFSNTRRTF